MTQEKLTFQIFIKQYFPDFAIDKHNQKIIELLNVWANRIEKQFNQKEPGWHIDKGILLYGPVGTGKTQLMGVLRKYLGYLRSPYAFDMRIVWKFAEKFSDSGYSALNDEESSNRFYDELALIEENSGQPLREYCSHYGNKILIGAEILMKRYEVFRTYAYQSHFTTNAGCDDLRDIYGERCYSRLFEMCNFIPYLGEDRRKKPNAKPIFVNNRNNPKPPVQGRSVSEDEIFANKKKLDEDYKRFCTTGEFSKTLCFDYDLLIVNGVVVAEEEELKLIMQAVEKSGEIGSAASIFSPFEKEKAIKQYRWQRTREIAVMTFYQKMKDHGAKSIFGIINVDITGFTNGKTDKDE
jgi:hypothetical protein